MKNFTIYLMNVNKTYLKIEFNNKEEMENFIESFREVKKMKKSCFCLKGYEFFFRAESMLFKDETCF